MPVHAIPNWYADLIPVVLISILTCFLQMAFAIYVFPTYDSALGVDSLPMSEIIEVDYETPSIRIGIN